MHDRSRATDSRAAAVDKVLESGAAAPLARAARVRATFAHAFRREQTGLRWFAGARVSATS
jgi:hypothetical protein